MVRAALRGKGEGEGRIKYLGGGWGEVLGVGVCKTDVYQLQFMAPGEVTTLAQSVEWRRVPFVSMRARVRASTATCNISCCRVVTTGD